MSSEFNINDLQLKYLELETLLDITNELNSFDQISVLLIPSIIYTLMTLGLPESPRWLFSVKNDEAGARQNLAIVGVENIDETIQEIKTAYEEEKAQGTIQLFTKHHSKIISIAFFVAFFNQASGINFLLYYAPRILEEAGFAKNNSPEK